MRMSKNEQPDPNTGEKWSELELFDLRNAVERGYKVAEIAIFLMRTEAEVRRKLFGTTF